MIVYGIKQCDTCRKACRWLDDNNVAYDFHDLRQDGFDEEMLAAWRRSTDVEQLVNRRSTTWRQLDPAQRDNDDPEHLAGLLLAHPTLIKRPVFWTDHIVAIGFKPDQLQDLLA